MYHHVKKLMYTVRVDEPDPKLGNMVLEQFGGANGKPEAAMKRWPVPYRATRCRSGAMAGTSGNFANSAGLSRKT